MTTAAGATRRARTWTPIAGAAAVALAVAPALGAQTAVAPAAVVVAGVGVATALMVDGNGTTVRLAPSPTLALHLSPRRWRVGPVAAGLAVRAAGAPLRLSDGGEHWSGGRAWQLDFLAQGSLPLAHDRLTVAGGAGATWLRSGGRAAPLQHSIVAPAAEATVLFRPAGPRWALAVTAQGYLVRPDFGRDGGVGRLVAGVARAF